MEHTTKPRYSQTTGGRHSNGTKANLTTTRTRVPGCASAPRGHPGHPPLHCDGEGTGGG